MCPEATMIRSGLYSHVTGRLDRTAPFRRQYINRDTNFWSQYLQDGCVIPATYERFHRDLDFLTQSCHWSHPADLHRAQKCNLRKAKDSWQGKPSRKVLLNEGRYIHIQTQSKQMPQLVVWSKPKAATIILFTVNPKFMKLISGLPQILPARRPFSNL